MNLAQLGVVVGFVAITLISYVIIRHTLHNRRIRRNIRRSR
jgi:hypothetical protein